MCKVLTSFNAISIRLGSFDRTSLACTKIWKATKTLVQPSKVKLSQLYYENTFTW